MEAMEDGVDLHTPPTRLPPLRDTLMSGEAHVSFSCHLFHVILPLYVLEITRSAYVKVEVSIM